MENKIHAGSLNEINYEDEKQEQMCRICFQSQRPLLKVCGCIGTISYVHQACIFKWIVSRLRVTNRVQTSACQICHQKFYLDARITGYSIRRSKLIRNVLRLTALEITQLVFSFIFILVCLCLIARFLFRLLTIIPVLQDTTNILLQICFSLLLPNIVLKLCIDKIWQKKWLISNSMVPNVELTLQPTVVLENQAN